MATSGTTDYTLQIDEAIEDAIGRAGGEPTLGADISAAKRALNLLLTEWTNRGVNLWKLEQTIVTLSVSTTSYTLEDDTVDVLRAVYRNTSTSNDFAIERISYENYLDLPNKGTSGRPTQYMIERRRDSVVMNVWPVPSEAQQILYWKIGRIEDVNRLTEEADVPYRFYPPLVSGLAWYIARSRPGVPREEKEALKIEYERDLELAMGEDRDRANFYIVPRLNRVR